MLFRQSLVLLCLALLSSLPLHAQNSSVLDRLSGVITHIDSPTSFAVSGAPVELAPTAAFGHRVGNTTTFSPHPAELYLGQPVELRGHTRHKKPFLAEELRTADPEPLPVSGAGLIERVFSPDALSLPGLPPAQPTQLVLADGYLLRVPTAVLRPGTPNPLTPNLLLAYRGHLRADGSVEVSAAGATKPVVTEAEAKLRERVKYDSSTITTAETSTPQGELSRAFRGLDPARLPLNTDADLQNRVSRIGLSLIPPAQRSLAPTDAAYLPLTFHIVDAPSDLHTIFALPSGAILIPAAAIQYLRIDNPTEAQLDSRLASLLAFGLAEVLEKQTLRFTTTSKNIAVATVAGEVATAFVPGLPLVAVAAGSAAQEHVARTMNEQADRVSLALLQQAGYNLAEAPVASQLLDAKSPRPLRDIPLTSGTLDLYTELGRLYGPHSLASRLPPAPEPPLTPTAPAPAAPAAPPSQPAP